MWRQDKSDAVLIKLIDLVQAVLAQREQLATALVTLTREVETLSTHVVQLRRENMAQFDSLKAKVDTLQGEIGEITEFVHSKAAELQAALDENIRLTARIAELEPNQITAEDRAALAESEAKLQAGIEALDAFTPATPVPTPEPAPEG